MDERPSPDRGLAEALRPVGFATRWKAGETLLRAGEPCDVVILVETGRLKVIIFGEDGAQSLLGFLGPGDLAGELAVLDGEPHSATVIATVPGGGLRVAPTALRQVIETDPGAALALARQLAGRLREADSLREEAASADATARVASRLLRLAGRDGAVEPVVIEMTQDDLAKWCGLSRQATNVALAGLRHDGVLTTGRGRITVDDLAGLRLHARPATRR